MEMNGNICTAFEHGADVQFLRGHCSHISPNRVSRRFTTDRPYQNVFTDVTEVCLGSGTMAERA